MIRNALLLASFTSLSVLAGPPEQPKPITNEPPYVTVGIPPQRSSEKFVYGEQSVAGARPILLTPDQANGVITRFKAAYPKMGNPRFVLYVNRELVDENSGLKATARTQKTEISDKGEKTVTESSYKSNEKPASTLEDKQTERDVERLFGRPLRMAGANLVDQRIASQMAADVPLKELKGGSDQARKDRDALSKVADVAIEILISSHNLTYSEVSGDNTVVVPEIHATAVRLRDALVLGQATSADIIGRAPASFARFYDMREIAEATALSLMEDMLQNAPQ